ncbi:hypothetical protein GCM10011316_25700 [Roseibium aquae]|uniref:Porin n=1 Tax=Roseibium aquae TaxID=1323746 RepID=A0A916TLE7_9HYPH|nr:porin [Roseibium aquae]GGB52520.1 hypothetical protein GCM10011316_25700 [Roseibium aquae]
MKLTSVVATIGLCSATALNGAYAADLPVAPEPVAYVRVCDAHGNGFFYLPGTETCLRVSGRVRADYRFRDFGDAPNRWDSDTDMSTEFRARGYVRLDARTHTEFGLLRTYVGYYITNTTGGSDDPTLEYAYIQFGGLTAGRATSFWDFWTGYAMDMQLETYSDTESNLFAYTYGFGNDLSASLSVEHGTERRNNIAGVGTLVSTNLYGGHKWPDLVANLNIDQDWGSAQLMGALHHVYVNSSTAAVADSPLGWAIGGGVEVKLGQFFGGGKTKVALQGVYTDGASGYATTGWANRITDAVVVDGTDTRTTKTWSIYGGIHQPLSGTVSFNLDAGYHNADAGVSAFDFTQWDITPNVTWVPVSGLEIGAEIQYRDLDYSAVSGLADTNEFVGSFRIQRSF